MNISIKSVIFQSIPEGEDFIIFRCPGKNLLCGVQGEQDTALTGPPLYLTLVPAARNNQWSSPVTTALVYTKPATPGTLDTGPRCALDVEYLNHIAPPRLLP